MANKITHGVRAELANAVRRRYRSAAGKEKRKILDEFIATTGYLEKSAIRVWNGQPAVIYRQTRQRPSLYDEAAHAAVIVLWEASDRVCGKRLRSLIPILMSALERHGHLRLQEEIRSKVLALLGLIAHLIDSTLQDDIVTTSQRLLQLGQDILDRQVSDAPQTAAAP